MKLRSCLLFCCLISAAACAAEQSAAPEQPTVSASAAAATAKAIAEADQLFVGRSDLARVREAIALLVNAQDDDLNSYEIAWRLARFNHYLGDNTEDADERDRAFRAGVAAGEEAVRLQPGKPEGHFWLGANLGGRAQVQGPLSSLATVKDIRREMETVLKIDEGYLGGSAYMVLGQVDLEMPELLGGDRKRAVENLEKGLRYGENNLLLRLRLAEAYLAVKRPEEARKQLTTIISMPPDPEYLPEYTGAVAEARRLLGRKGP